MNAPQNLDELDDVDLAALSTRVLHDMVAKMTPEDRQRYRDALDAADAAGAPLRDLLGAALGVLDPSSTAPGKKCATCRGAFSGMSWDTLCPSCWEEKLRKEREAKTAPKFQWPTTASKLKRVAAELVRAAEMMGGADDDGEEADLVLSVAPTGWISLTEDRTGGRNEHPILTVHLAEYPEEGSYPVDPLDPTAGQPDESNIPATGDAQTSRDSAFEAVRKRLCALPRYSFLIGPHGGVKRYESRSGNWIEFDAAHDLFDPVAVDAALTATRQQEG